MMTAYLVLLLAVVAWKGYLACRRGMKTYHNDRLMHDSLREYLLGNGATTWQSLWPFYRPGQRCYDVAVAMAFLPSRIAKGVPAPAVDVALVAVAVAAGRPCRVADMRKRKARN